jgi:hypothetical protein
MSMVETMSDSEYNTVMNSRMDIISSVTTLQIEWTKKGAGI